MPVRALGAPQTTCTGPWPASTMQTFSRSALGCAFASITEATTKPSYLRAGSSTDSTSRPTRGRGSTISLRGGEVERLEAIVINPAQVRIEKVAQVRQAVFEHRQAIEADPPGETLINLGIDAAIGQHVGMDHAAAQDFEPILAFAEADFVARAAALDVDLERGRREWKKARAQAHANAGRFEERLAEFLQHPLEVGERRTIVDDQALDLVEHGRMRLVGIAPIGASGANDPDRRLLREHRAHLHRARVGAQNFPLALIIRLEKERFVHLA